MSYSVDLSSRVINWVLSGKSRKSASEVFEVHYNTVKQWVKRFKETGEYPTSVTKRPSRPRQFDREELRQAVLESPETFQSEHASRFGVSQSAISQTLAKMGLTRKKKPPTTKNKMKNKNRLFKTFNKESLTKPPSSTLMSAVFLKISTENTVGPQEGKKSLGNARGNERRS